MGVHEIFGSRGAIHDPRRSLFHRSDEPDAGSVDRFDARAGASTRIYLADR